MARIALLLLSKLATTLKVVALAVGVFVNLKS